VKRRGSDSQAGRDVLGKNPKFKWRGRGDNKWPLMQACSKQSLRGGGGRSRGHENPYEKPGPGREVKLGGKNSRTNATEVRLVASLKKRRKYFPGA